MVSAFRVPAEYIGIFLDADCGEKRCVVSGKSRRGLQFVKDNSLGRGKTLTFSTMRHNAGPISVFDMSSKKAVGCVFFEPTQPS